MEDIGGHKTIQQHAHLCAGQIKQYSLC